MSHKPEGQIVREHWPTKYLMLCDVILHNKAVSNVSVEVFPPYEKAKVRFPDGLSLTEEEKSKIENLVLWNYYGLDSASERESD